MSSGDIGDNTVWKLIETIQEITVTLSETNKQLANVTKALTSVDLSLMFIKDELEEQKKEKGGAC
jgi:hypothetical protein